MAPIPRREAVSHLLQKGFTEIQGGNHIVLFYTAMNGKRLPIKTYVSRSSKCKTLSDTLIACMAKQCRLKPNQFRTFAKCELDQQGYEDILKQEGIL